jgi:hypothetical protein
VLPSDHRLLHPSPCAAKHIYSWHNNLGYRLCPEGMQLLLCTQCAPCGRLYFRWPLTYHSIHSFQLNQCASDSVRLYG